MTRKPVSKDPQKEKKKWSNFRKRLMERKDWEKELERAFPKVKLPKFGCQCNKGWYKPIYELFFHLNACLSDDEILEISQLKEKFGMLRCYLKNDDPKFDYWISLYEEKSGTICEVCGEPGELRSKPIWLKTLCNKCAKEKGYAEKVSRRIIKG